MKYKMSRRERLLFYLTMIIIGVFVVHWWVLRPTLTRSHALSQQIQLKKRMIESSLYLLKQKAEILESAGRFAKYGKQGLSEEEEAAFLLRQIEETAKKSSVQMIDLKPYSARRIDSRIEYKVELEIESPINQLMTFIYNLQNSDDLLRTSKFRISPREGNPSVLKAYLTITKVSLP